MGRLQKKLVAKISDITKNCKSSRKQLSLSIVSLVLATVILISATYCWYTLSKGVSTASNVNLTAGNGLRVNDLGDTFKEISDNSYLLPASSVSGRNLFFPADGTDFSSETTKMTFRSANSGDRNYDYVQLDFNLTAEANYTSIYLEKNTNITVRVPDDASPEYKEAAAKAQKAIRTAIYYEGMSSPVVFTSQNNPVSVEAVKDIDRTTGRYLESSTQVAVPFKDYSYGKRQLAMLNRGETRPFSLIIWLEGTDENCTSDIVMLKQLEINLTFTTSWDNTETIQFIDETEGAKVSEYLTKNPGCSLMLDYTNRSHKIENLKFTMYRDSTEKTNDIWYCNIPGNAYNDLTFQIVNDADGSVVYEWNKDESGESTKNRGTATKYYADAFEEDSQYGHWYDGDIEDKGDGEDIGDIDDGDW